MTTEAGDFSGPEPGLIKVIARTDTTDCGTNRENRQTVGIPYERRKLRSLSSHQAPAVSGSRRMEACASQVKQDAALEMV